MSEIKLIVESKNVELLLTILNNLKSGLIQEIETDRNIKTETTHYKPKSNGVIYEHESGTSDKSGKYSVSAYRDRLKKSNREKK